MSHDQYNKHVRRLEQINNINSIKTIQKFKISMHQGCIPPPSSIYAIISNIKIQMQIRTSEYQKHFLYVKLLNLRPALQKLDLAHYISPGGLLALLLQHTSIYPTICYLQLFTSISSLNPYGVLSTILILVLVYVQGWP